MASASPVSAVANPRLVKPDGSVALFMDGANVVGRDDGLAVSLVGESSVSRQHARLDKSGDDVRLTDLGSTNGTFVNGARISAETPLRVGDTVQFGAVSFRFEA
jgi:pSer/pThr/pTyr-binding forkhead associated (FHA) protein